MVAPTERVKLLKQLVKNGDINLVFMDCETSPMITVTHYIGNNVSIYPEQVLVPKKIMTIQYMYEGDKSPKYLEWDHLPKTKSNLHRFGDDHDDSNMIEEYITNIHNKPDTIVVGQNHKTFDIKTINERAVKLQLTPMNHDLVLLDTLQLSKSAFRFISHRLDYRSKEYGLGGKLDMCMQDWVDVLINDVPLDAKFVPYGCKDVMDLRDIFWRELPYYPKLPAPLEKLLSKTRQFCSDCASRHQAKFNIEEKKLNGRKGWICLNCGHRWEDK